MLRTFPVILACSLLATSVAMSSAASAQVPAAPVPSKRQRFPITNNAIVAVLALRGLTVVPSQVELPLQLSTESSSPGLEISGTERLGDDHLRVRLFCDNSRDCLPFFALVRFPEKEHTAEAFLTLNSNFHPVQLIRPGGSPALRAGEHTVLFMEDDHMRISLPVISIDSGAVGSEVRVSSLDHKKVYQAVVLGTQAVRGNLP